MIPKRHRHSLTLAPSLESAPNSINVLILLATLAAGLLWGPIDSRVCDGVSPLAQDLLS